MYKVKYYVGTCKVSCVQENIGLQIMDLDMSSIQIRAELSKRGRAIKLAKEIIEQGNTKIDVKADKRIVTMSFVSDVVYDGDKIIHGRGVHNSLKFYNENILKYCFYQPDIVLEKCTRGKKEVFLLYDKKIREFVYKLTDLEIEKFKNNVAKSSDIVDKLCREHFVDFDFIDYKKDTTLKC